MLNMKNLEKCFQEAKEYGATYIAVVVKTEGNKSLEVIINPRSNFDNKLEYYKKAYTEDLVLKAFNGIRIEAFTYGSTFSQIEEQLF